MPSTRLKSTEVSQLPVCDEEKTIQSAKSFCAKGERFADVVASSKDYLTSGAWDDICRTQRVGGVHDAVVSEVRS
jgi:hypothetical protein